MGRIQTFSNTGAPNLLFDLQNDTTLFEVSGTRLFDLKNGNIAFFWGEVDSEPMVHLKYSVYGHDGELLLDGHTLVSMPGMFYHRDSCVVLEEGVGFVFTYYTMDVPAAETTKNTLYAYSYLVMGLDYTLIRPPEILDKILGEMATGTVDSLGNGKFCLSFQGFNVENLDFDNIPEDILLLTRFVIYDINSNLPSSVSQIDYAEGSSAGRTIATLKDGSGTFIIAYVGFQDILQGVSNGFHYDVYDSNGSLLKRINFDRGYVNERNIGVIVGLLDSGAVLIAHDLERFQPDAKLEYFFIKNEFIKPFGLALQNALSGDELNVQIDGINKEFRNLKAGKKYYTQDGVLTRDDKGDYVGNALGPDTLLLKPGN